MPPIPEHSVSGAFAYSGLGHTIRHFDSVTSTNDVALSEREHGVVYVARAQTRGRGRHGHHWISAPGLGLWFSVGLTMPPQGLTFAAALAVRDGLMPELDAEIRWPNDLYASGKKIGGILVEHRNGHSALGIGVNVHHRPEDFPPDLEKPAASLAMLSGVAWEAEAVLQRILGPLNEYVTRLQQGFYAEVHQAWADALGLLGRRIQRGEVSGKVCAIREDGALLVETPTGAVRIDSGLIEQVD
ncbi:MAG: biotin--[acetyl-CoA-carboxylase] ligase [Candidatus Hydrogenedentes bacterium]|nr:biotin--[acetyl-CoA-carboxylase] ligase [Candidatus Hydrogenedentota bacterium]